MRREARLFRKKSKWEARMRYASVIFTALLSCLAGVFANGPANAGVFAFSFGPGATGTFTTDGPAADPAMT
jgi:hypothetical protein